MRSLYKMGAYGSWFILLPAQLTWLLQPLGVKVFGYIKAFLRQRFITVPAQNFNDSLVLTAIRDVFAAVEKWFVNRSWGKAFDTLGLNGGIPPSSKHILVECGWTVFPPIIRTRPTTAVICSNTPKGRILHADALRRCMPPVYSELSPRPANMQVTVSSSVTRGNHVEVQPEVSQRRVLPPTFALREHDSDHNSD